MTVDKLAKEYQDKIKSMDRVISAKTEAIRRNRKEMRAHGRVSIALASIDLLTFEKKKAETSRQNYVQFISDLESLSIQHAI